MTEVRPDVVGLLLAIDFTDTAAIETVMSGGGATVRRQNGVPLTDAEVRLMKTATVAELQAVADYGRRVADYHTQRTRDLQRIVELTRPYYDLNPAAVLADVLPAMPAPERAEVEELVKRIAPDGTVFIEGNG